GNDCMLRNAACMARRNGQVLTMASEGRCAVKKPEENMANTCMRACPRIYRPVCGSNSRTYCKIWFNPTEICKILMSVSPLIIMSYKAGVKEIMVPWGLWSPFLTGLTGPDCV
ncbi:unnamed protein product, partial [Owenia fusiformis]